jgi:type II secretory ATPase GspE/PulE/Tfp pilus assembly ATPase PilB-like protein
MSDADPDTPQRNDTSQRLLFFRKLQAVTTKIHATSNIDEIMLDLGAEFCDLLNCDRCTLYAMDFEKDYIVSKVKTGSSEFRDLKLAVTPSSIAGYVALTHQTLNIADVYDTAELRRISPDLHFQQGVDQRTSYRTREMLVAPLIAEENNELLGVLQFINHRAGGPFTDLAVEGVRELCKTLSVALSQRLNPDAAMPHAFDGTLTGTADIGNEPAMLVNRIITDACRQGVSDIHIEPLPGKGKTAIRFRKDGVLMPHAEIPSASHSALVERIKVMCNLDINERRKPQDGKIRFRNYGAMDIDLRVATIPSTAGEDVVLRILAAGEPVPLAKLGMLPANLDRLRATMEKPYGLFFVCGPAGSGKTTTLHSLLNYLNTPETKIWTAEDPVEITQKGLRQVQVNRKAGLDFAAVMRAVLHADPDVIMVGEMRDRETVSLGIEASLTGHLVLSTLHTNSAPESMVRLLDMGMDPFNFSDALLGILAQRLARRLCTRCKEPYHPGEAELELLLAEYCEDLHHTEAFRRDAPAAETRIAHGWREHYADAQGQFTLYRPVGCDECNKGYRGRVGLHELMLGTERVKKLLQEHARAAPLLAAALEDGMLSLKMDGIEKVLLGITDVKAVRAACIK